MEFPDEITIEGKSYTRVDIQRGGLSAIYCSDNEYVRIGEVGKITADLSMHKRMAAHQFPVAGLLGEGAYGDLYYFKEQSLGDHCFGEIFEREYSVKGMLSSDSWQQFMTLCEQFARAQISTSIKAQSWDAFEAGVHLDFALDEKPEYAQLLKDAFAAVKSRLSAFPFVVTHGDLTPFNMYPGGIIDLEDSFQAPLGFDLMALIAHLEWFPDTSTDRLHKLYTFSPDQHAEFVTRIDVLHTSKGLLAPSLYLREFNFAKGVWFAVRLQKYPSLMEFRYDHLVRCAHELLAPPHRKP